MLESKHRTHALACVRAQLIIANGTMERKKDMTHASTVDEQVRRGARCFS